MGTEPTVEYLTQKLRRTQDELVLRRLQGRDCLTQECEIDDLDRALMRAKLRNMNVAMNQLQTAIVRLGANSELAAQQISTTFIEVFRSAHVAHPDARSERTRAEA